MNELDDDYAYVGERGPKLNFGKKKPAEPKPEQLIIENIEEIIAAGTMLEKDGKIYLVINASKFADKHNINRTYMNQLINGKKDEVNGFSLRKLT